MPLAVHLHTQVIIDMNLAIASANRLQPERAEEIGGLLLGRIEYPTSSRPIIHIEKFDPIESEHRRGPSYDLSERDKRVLARKLAWWNSHGRKEYLRPVGFYRTHTRRGLYLDKDDSVLLVNYFPEPYAVVLLVRPEPGGNSVGGFFFWEDGDMHREATYQEFPFNPAKLPLVSAPPAPATELPGLRVDGEPALPPSTGQIARPESTVQPHSPASSWGRMALPVAVGLIAGAIVYGLVVHKPQTRPASERRTALSARATKPAPEIAAVTPVQPPAASAAPAASAPPIAPIEKPSPFLQRAKTAAKSVPAAPVRTANPQPPQPPPSPTGSASRTSPAPTATVVVPSRAEPAPPPATVPEPPVLAPISAPVRIEQPRHPVRHATVTVEPVSGSKIGRVVGHIPGLGRLRKRDKGFVPARPIRQVTPTVPADEHLANDVPVDVKVTVDPAGNVASVDSRGGDKQLSRLAADAARNWQFVPARHNDETVTSEMILHFTFKGTAAQP
jgi:Gram-negative bacterial TonB protein C-terminal